MCSYLIVDGGDSTEEQLTLAAIAAVASDSEVG